MFTLWKILLDLWITSYSWHKATSATSVEIWYFFGKRKSQVTSTTTIDLRGISISHNIFCPSYFCSKFFSFFTGQWETKDYESPTHNSDIIINYFVVFFQCVLMFYHFWFIRLLNTSNCFIITFSLNDFIHELTFLLKDAIWDKYLVRSKRASWECWFEFIDFLSD